MINDRTVNVSNKFCVYPRIYWKFQSKIIYAFSTKTALYFGVDILISMNAGVFKKIAPLVPVNQNKVAEK